MRRNALFPASPMRVLGMLLAAFCLVPMAEAQQSGSGNELPGTMAGGAAANPALLNSPQSQQTTDPNASATPPKRAWTFAPRITVGETFTDNVFLQSAKRSDQITEISPGIRISGESARLKAYFDYAYREFLYAQGTHQRSNQALNTFGSLTLLENHLFVDFSGVIAQQAISAFGAQSPSAASVNTNMTETSNIRFSPYWRGRLGEWANYELRYGLTNTTSKASTIADTVATEWSAQLNGGNERTAFGWGLSANSQSYDYSRGRDTESKQVRATVSYKVIPTLKLTLIGGSEENDFLSSTSKRHSTNGVGIDWTPTERTKLSLTRERRFFGDSHSFVFEHRTPLSAIRITDTRNVSYLPTQLMGGTVGNIYDILFAQFASIEPDPVKRATLVTAYMQANGIAPNATVTSGFLNSGPLVQRRQDVTFSLIGVRNTLTFLASQSESSRLGALTGSSDDLAAASAVRQRGFSATWAHRVSGLTTFNLLGSQQVSSSGAGAQETTMRMLNANLTTKVGAHTGISLGLRRALFESRTNPYAENALLGSITLQY